MTLHRAIGAFIFSLMSLAGLSACSGEAPETSEPSMRLYVMDCGRLQVHDLSRFSRNPADYEGQTSEFVATCVLIRHPDGDFIYDVGLPDYLNETPEGVSRGSMTYSVPRTLVSQLAELDMTPSDVEYLSVSHGHGDHAGNANLFAQSQWLVDPAERSWMFSEDSAQHGVLEDSVSELKSSQWTAVNEDHDVFGDGSVVLLRTPGHTPGHLSLLVRMEEEGSFMFTGDLYHLRENRRFARMPAFNMSFEKTAASMKKFEEIAESENARVIISHLIEDFESLPAFPAYME